MWKVAVLGIGVLPALGNSKPPRTNSRMQTDRR